MLCLDTFGADLMNTEFSFSFCSTCPQKGLGGNTVQVCGLIYKGLVYKISSQFDHCRAPKPEDCFFHS